MSLSDFKAKIVLGVIMLAALIVMIIGGAYKKTTDQDEAWSYGSANSTTIHLTYNYDKDAYNKITSQELHDYLTVQKSEMFDWSIPFYAMYNDNHPPLFFYALHTVSSFFPDSYSPWYGMGLNIAFFMLSLIALFFLAKAVTGHNAKSLVTVFLYAFSCTAYRTFLYVRMYGMLTFFVILFLYAAIMYFKTRQRRYLLYYFFGIFYGGLTHYSSWVYGGVLTLFFCIALVILPFKRVSLEKDNDTDAAPKIYIPYQRNLWKNFRNALCFGGSALGALACAIAAYPPIVMQFSYTTPIKNSWQNRAYAALDTLDKFYHPNEIIETATQYLTRFAFPTVDYNYYYKHVGDTVLILAWVLLIALCTRLVANAVTKHNGFPESAAAFARDFFNKETLLVALLLIPTLLSIFLITGFFWTMAFIGRYYCLFIPVLIIFGVSVLWAILKQPYQFFKKINFHRGFAKYAKGGLAVVLSAAIAYAYIPVNFKDFYEDKKDWVHIANTDFDEDAFINDIHGKHIIVCTDNAFFSQWNIVHLLSFYFTEIIDVRVVPHPYQIPECVRRIRRDEESNNKNNADIAVISFFDPYKPADEQFPYHIEYQFDLVGYDYTVFSPIEWRKQSNWKPFFIVWVRTDKASGARGAR